MSTFNEMELEMGRMGMDETAHSPVISGYDVLSRILRGELAAVEAYEQVLEKFKGEPESQRLMRFMLEHQRAANFWRDEILSKGVSPEVTAGPWGQVVKTLVGTAKLFGDTPTLQALEVGENHGLAEYQSLLENKNVPERLKRRIREDFIPAQEQHIVSLEAMKELH